MTCQRFELLGTFLHIVTVEEEEAVEGDQLQKIRPLYNHIKEKCIALYQPAKHLYVDERMVKSKARSHLVQCMKDKPVKWGFQYWVLADSSGYTVDFDLYTGKSNHTEHGLAYDVVLKLMQPFCFQGYEVFTDNFYSSPDLFDEVLSWGITATGMLRTNRMGIPKDVIGMKADLQGTRVPHGTGYYLREQHSPIVYICWRDKLCVTAISTAYPSHSEDTVRRREKDSDGKIPANDNSLPPHITAIQQIYGRC